jgi:hypothetical protein
MVVAKRSLVHIIAMMHMLRLKRWETYYTKKIHVVHPLCSQKTFIELVNNCL